MIKQQITYKNVSDLIPYARNSRTHSDAQVLQIAASIKEFGFTNPILIDGENGIIAGHGRILAAMKLGIGEVPCIELSGMTDTQKRAYIITDNKLALSAGWDNELLNFELKELNVNKFDLSLTGFDVERLLGNESIVVDNERECDFKPKLSPSISSVMVTQEQVINKADELVGQFLQKGNKCINVVCPNCGEEFNVSD